MLLNICIFYSIFYINQIIKILECFQLFMLENRGSVLSYSVTVWLI
ncbi:unnamed protein product [Paramecium sonneborni]|uniref:Uncharacterized protein n=1 Tax=Paramecium sonneborni TaxID=65129 RepID=A0A8S1RGZ4_9CILI|nr:unnamed protein product [Paramecium sonneborni]